MKTIIICIDYFGHWPDWFPVFLISCRANPTINWCIHTDCPVPTDGPPNVRFVSMTFEDYCQQVSDRLGVHFAPRSAYSICNLKPIFGQLHYEMIKEFDYFGFGDIDVIYGDIRSIYDECVLSCNVITTDSNICTGHLTLIKNVEWLREAFREITGWQDTLENPAGEWETILDEAGLSALFCPKDEVRNNFGRSFNTYPPSADYYNNNYFVEQWTTPFVPYAWRDIYKHHPEEWYWQNGRLTNSVDGDLGCLYLHLMNFKSKRWVNEELYGRAPTWDNLDTCLRFRNVDLISKDIENITFRIDRGGIHIIQM